MKRLLLGFTITLFIPITLANQKLFVSTPDVYITKICRVIVKEAFRKVNIDVEPVILPSQRAVLMSNSGKTDGEVCRIRNFNKKHTNLIRIDPTILPLEGSVFTKDKSINIVQNQWELLKPYRIGIHAGHYYSTNGTRGFPKVSIITDDIQLIMMLDASRVDIAVMILTDGLYEIKKANMIGKIKVLQPPIARHPLHFFLHKKNKHLVSSATKAIEAIVQSGRSMVIYNKFLDDLQK